MIISNHFQSYIFMDKLINKNIIYLSTIVHRYDSLIKQIAVRLMVAIKTI